MFWASTKIWPAPAEKFDVMVCVSEIQVKTMVSVKIIMLLENTLLNEIPKDLRILGFW